MILNIVESALPNGVPSKISKDNRMQEMFHKALELLPKLWIVAGRLDEAIAAYRRALVKPWNLDPLKSASAQKELASILIYGGIDVRVPPPPELLWGQTTPRCNLEEAILLLFILVIRESFNEIEWDQKIMDHLSFALSMCNGFEFLAQHVELVLTGIYNRAERRFTLALYYNAARKDPTSLDLVRKITGHSESKHIPHIPSLFWEQSYVLTIRISLKKGLAIVVEFMIPLSRETTMHWLKLISSSGFATPMPQKYQINSEREMYRKGSPNTLNKALSIAKDDPELMFNLGLENALQGILMRVFSTQSCTRVW